MVIADGFSMMAHFVLYHKIDNTSHIAHLYYKEIIKLHSVPRSIVSHIDTKFLSRYWRSLCRLLGTKLLFSTMYYPQTDG